MTSVRSVKPQVACVLCSVLVSGGATAAPLVIQSNADFISQESVRVALASPPANGSIIVVGASANLPTFDVTDSAGNVYQPLTPALTGVGGLAAYTQRLFATVGPSAGDGGVFSVRLLAPTAGYVQLFVAEVARADLINPFDGTVSEIGASLIAQTSPIVTTTTDGLMLAHVVSGGVASVGGGFSQVAFVDQDLLESAPVATVGPHIAEAVSTVANWMIQAVVVRAAQPDVGSGDAGTDAGTDAGGVDSGLDAGTIDSGIDAGALDAGAPDAATDAGVASDAGLVDAGPVDSGVLDAGSGDAGVDAGAVNGDANLHVGCGCVADTGGLLWASLLVVFGRRRAGR